MTCFAAIQSEIKAHDVWNVEVKSRRDPVAHRIPLYLPPAEVTDEEAKKINDLLDKQLAKTVAGQYEEANRLSAQASAIGRFLPAFLHHPDSDVLPIYPTVPNDAGHLIKIGRAVLDTLDN
jgi:hypothetical protein